MKRVVIKNPILGKIIVLFFLSIFIFYFFLVSSYKISLNCENGICNLKSIHLLGEKNKYINLIGNDFCCREKPRRKYDVIENRRYIYTLMLHEDKIFRYSSKNNCIKELNNINNALHKNNSYSNIYKDYISSFLYKIPGIILAIFAFIVMIGKISPVNVELKTRKRK